MELRNSNERPAGTITFSLAAVQALVIAVAREHAGVVALAKTHGHTGVSPELSWNHAGSGVSVYATSVPMSIDLGVILAAGAPIATTAAALAAAVEGALRAGFALDTRVNVRVQGVR